MRRPFYSHVEIRGTELDVFQAMMDSTFKRTPEGKMVTTRDRKGNTPVRFKVVHAQRLENSALWKLYAARRFAIKGAREDQGCMPVVPQAGALLAENQVLPPELQDHLQKDINEVYLWHGTTPQGALGISKRGFLLSLAGSRARRLMFGH
eukprot:5441497-Amphidinium_carterae.1